MNIILASFITGLAIVAEVNCYAQDVTQLKLKDFRPVSIYHVPVTIINKAKFPVIDMHAHVFARSDEELAQWVKTMDRAGIELSVSWKPRTSTSIIFVFIIGLHKVLA